MRNRQRLLFQSVYANDMEQEITAAVNSRQ